MMQPIYCDLGIVVGFTRCSPLHEPQRGRTWFGIVSLTIVVRTLMIPLFASRS